MKLSADIIFRRLREKYNVTISGPRSSELHLGRPEFYMEQEEIFRSDHLYLATADHLPSRPVIRRNAVLVCVGDQIRLKYYKERLCVITIHNKADFFRVFQALQEIYDQFDEWERTLNDHLIHDQDIQMILTDSADIFRKQILMIDHAFRLVANTGGEEGYAASFSGSGSLESSDLSTYLDSFDLMTEKRGALKINIGGHKTLCVNLFDRDGRYEGCLFIEQKDDFPEGEDRLAEYLARTIELALEKNPQVLNSEQSSMKALLKALIEEQPLSASERWLLNASNQKFSFSCILLEYATQKNRVPAGYLCDLFEEVFAQSYALNTEAGILCFLNEKPEEAFRNKLNEFAADMHVCAGISQPFSDLFSVRISYLQAQAALENGKLLDPGKKLYFFSDHALTTMVINSLGDLPAEAYFPAGFREILRHDDSSGVSYLETLKVFLEENMSYTAASKRLYIHRSTLIDRIARIERELKIDLNDHDQKLLLEILLKAVDIEKMIRPQ